MAKDGQADRMREGRRSGQNKQMDKRKRDEWTSGKSIWTDKWVKRRFKEAELGMDGQAEKKWSGGTDKWKKGTDRVPLQPQPPHPDHSLPVRLQIFNHQLPVPPPSAHWGYINFTPNFCTPHRMIQKQFYHSVQFAFAKFFAPILLPFGFS